MRIILEELSKADKNQIEKIAKQAAKEEVDKAIRKAFKDDLKKEVKKALGDKASEEEIVKICKKVFKKFYKDLSINYPQLIDRLKL